MPVPASIIYDMTLILPKVVRFFPKVSAWCSTASCSSIALSQNYPNPFNSSTAFTYILPAGTQVDMAVYDLRGRRVRVLLQGLQEAGTHEAVWDGTAADGEEAVSGVYILVLRAGDTVERRKLVLVR